MADIFEVINSRRSVREYKEDQLKDEEIEKILGAAIMAPTALGEAPWHFTVIQSSELLEEINSVCHEIMKSSGDEFLEAIANSGKNIMHNAPSVIIISAKSDASNMQADCSAAIENMLLAAEGLDIGSCWLGLITAYFKHEENIAKLHIPEGFTPLYGVSLGYKLNDDVKTPDRNPNVVNWIK